MTEDLKSAASEEKAPAIGFGIWQLSPDDYATAADANQRLQFYFAT